MRVRDGAETSSLLGEPSTLATGQSQGEVCGLSELGTQRCPNWSEMGY